MRGVINTRTTLERCNEGARGDWLHARTLVCVRVGKGGLSIKVHVSWGLERHASGGCQGTEGTFIKTQVGRDVTIHVGHESTCELSLALLTIWCILPLDSSMLQPLQAQCEAWPTHKLIMLQSQPRCDPSLRPGPDALPKCNSYQTTNRIARL